MDLKGIIKGLHHVTATVNDAQEDYDFYTKVLGLRLVKETVNFDNEKVYHFYYGNQLGLPSTIFTTFPYKDQGVRQGVIGTGQVCQTSFSIPFEAYDFWKERLKTHRVEFVEWERFGHQVLVFKDPSGLRLDLTCTNGDLRAPLWSYEDINDDHAIIGIHSATLLIADIQETLPFLEAFGYRLRDEEGDLFLLEAGEGGAGNLIIVQSAPQGERGLNGMGTVHHLAHRIDNRETLDKVRAFIEGDLGLKPTEVKDRKYFQSIYFRIPGGVLFEVATEEPGFTVDESEEELGAHLMLPLWQEPNRDRIEANLLPYVK